RSRALPAKGKTRYLALISVSIKFEGYSAKFASGAAQNHPKSPPDSSGTPKYCTAGLISETNVFNLINQE
ncbi:MAG: hypothetical protein WCE24_09355, partial [Pseudolabrys sp.]